MEKRKIKKGVSLAENLSQNIIKYIISNNMKEGEKLPNEHQLGEIFQTGRGTVREAIKILTSKNIVEIKRGNGTYVSASIGIPDDPLGLEFLKDKTNIESNLMNIRFMLEPKIAALAAKNATKEDVLKIEKLCIEIEQYIESEFNYIKKDIEFHACIAEASKNTVMPNLISVINKSLIKYADRADSLTLKQIILSHREITQAIKNNDSKTAEKYMKLHLKFDQKTIHNIN